MGRTDKTAAGTAQSEEWLSSCDSDFRRSSLPGMSQSLLDVDVDLQAEVARGRGNFAFVAERAVLTRLCRSPAVLPPALILACAIREETVKSLCRQQACTRPQPRRRDLKQKIPQRETQTQFVRTWRLRRCRRTSHNGGPGAERDDFPLHQRLAFGV